MRVGRPMFQVMVCAAWDRFPPHFSISGSHFLCQYLPQSLRACMCMDGIHGGLSCSCVPLGLQSRCMTLARTLFHLGFLTSRSEGLADMHSCPLGCHSLNSTLDCGVRSRKMNLHPTL